MWKNYTKVALRHIHKHKGYAALNILGLAVGLACCLLIARRRFDVGSLPLACQDRGQPERDGNSYSSNDAKD